MKKYVFGVDIGGTTVKLGLFYDDGQLIDKWEIKTNTENNGETILDDIAEALNGKIAEMNIAREDVLGVGMGVPGPVNDDGLVLKCVNLGWGIFNIHDRMHELTGFKCKAGNDANVAALGEMYKGGAAGHKSSVMITLGTGVGGGIVINGKILSGENGAAGEIGHIHVKDRERYTCGCGKKGCLEQYASARGIGRVARAGLRYYKGDTVLRDINHIGSKEVFDAAKDGDEYALIQVDNLGKMLGKACATVACCCDPEIFVIGGGVSKAGSILIDTIEKHYKDYAFHACENTAFALAKLGNDAGIYGGAKLILG